MFCMLTSYAAGDTFALPSLKCSVQALSVLCGMAGHLKEARVLEVSLRADTNFGDAVIRRY